MKLRIIDLNQFEKTNACYITRDINFQYEYEILACSNYSIKKKFFNSIKKAKKFLILLKFDNYNFKLMWCKHDSSLEIFDNANSEDWIKTSKYTYYSEVDKQKLILRDLECPTWMIEDKTFLYDIIENHTIALDKFKSKNITHFIRVSETIIGKRIHLKLIEKNRGNENELPYYYYDIYLNDSEVQIGKISIRVGHNYHSYYNGNVGYEINEAFRGNHYALEAVKLLIDVAIDHEMDFLILSCDESNIASYKTIEKMGAILQEIIIPPKDYLFFYEGMLPQRIYRLEI